MRLTIGVMKKKFIALVVTLITLFAPQLAFGEVEFDEDPDINESVTKSPPVYSYNDIHSMPNEVEIGGKLYFVGPSNLYERTLYTMDSSNVITQVSSLDDLFRNPRNLISFKGNLLFIAEDSEYETALWSYDVSTDIANKVTAENFELVGESISVEASSDQVFILLENSNGSPFFFRYDGSQYATEYLDIKDALGSSARLGDVSGFATAGDKLVFQFGSAFSGKLFAADAAKASVTGADLVEVGFNGTDVSASSVNGTFGDDILIRLWNSRFSQFNRGVLANNDSYQFDDGIPTVKTVRTNGSIDTEGIYVSGDSLIRADFDNYDLQVLTIDDPAEPWKLTATSGDLTPSVSTNSDELFRFEVDGKLYASEFSNSDPDGSSSYLLSAADKTYLESEIGKIRRSEMIARPFVFNGLIWFQHAWGAEGFIEGVDPSDPDNVSLRVKHKLVDGLVQNDGQPILGFETGPLIFQNSQGYSYRFKGQSAQNIDSSDLDYVGSAGSAVTVSDKHYFVGYDSNFDSIFFQIGESGAEQISTPAGWELVIGSRLVEFDGDIYFLGDDTGSYSSSKLMRLETSDNSFEKVMSQSDIPDSNDLGEITSIGDYLYLVEQDSPNTIWRLDPNLSGSSIEVNDGLDDLRVEQVFDFGGEVFGIGCDAPIESCSQTKIFRLDFENSSIDTPIDTPNLLGAQGESDIEFFEFDSQGAKVLIPQMTTQEATPEAGEGLPVVFDGESVSQITNQIFFPMKAFSFDSRLLVIAKSHDLQNGPWALFELVDATFVKVRDIIRSDFDRDIEAVLASGELFITETSFFEGKKTSKLDLQSLSIVKTYAGNAETGSPSGLGVHSTGAVTIPSNSGNLSKAGHSFEGWNTLPDGTGMNYSEEQVVSDVGLLRLYPVFNETTYTLTFDTSTADSGSVSSITDSGSVSVPWPTDLTKSEHSFAGWNTKADGTGASYLQGSSISLTKNTTLYAQWVAVEESSPAPSPSPSPSPSVTVSTQMRAEIVNNLLVIHGSNLNTLDEVHVNGLSASILTKASAFALVSIPSGTNAADYKVDLFKNGQKFTQLKVESGLGLSSQEYGEASAWTKRISDTQAKVYVKYPTLGSKVRILHQTGGSGSYDSIFAKTIDSADDSSLRVVPGVGTYVVRTIDLAEINRIRVRIDDEQMWKVRYNR